MEALKQDIVFGLQLLRKHPAFTLVAVLTLALGIGANTAVFSVVNTVLMRPLPYTDAERIVVAFEKRPKQNRLKNEVTAAEFFEWRNNATSFESVAANSMEEFTLTGVEASAVMIGRRVSQQFFGVMGRQPMLGRVFTAAEDQPGGEKTAIISHALWQRQFGGSPDALGKTVLLNSQSYAVVGVMPSDFDRPSEVWVPLALDEAKARAVNNHYLYVTTRLKPGVTLAQAQVEMDTIASRIEQAAPATNTGHGVNLVPLREQLIGSVRPTLLILLGVVGLVLLIACANLANLLLARNTARQKELALRAALGASRPRLIRQLLTESVVLSLLGGGAGLLVAVWVVKGVLAKLNGRIPIPRLDEVQTDSRVLLFAFGVSLATGVFFGLLPALRASKTDLQEMLKEGGRGGTGGARASRMRGLLVVSEVALALMLLIGAGLLIKNFLQLRYVNPGFDAANALTMKVSLPAARYAQPEQQVAFYNQLIERARNMPGVEAAGAVLNLPLSGASMSRNFFIEGRPAAAPGEEPNALVNITSPDYFRAMGIPLVKGRNFGPEDTKQAPPVMLVNEAMARRFWPSQDAIGQRIQLGQGLPFVTVVGVVGDVKQSGLSTESRPEMYFSLLRSGGAAMSLVVRAKGDTAPLVGLLRGAVRELEPSQPIVSIQPVGEVVASTVAGQRVYSILLGCFAALALALACFGLYGVMSYNVTQRTHEIGIHMALGAKSRDILWLIIRQGMLPVLIGTVLGIAAAVALTRLLSTWLFGLNWADPAMYAGISILLTVVALLASYVPARRAARVDPMVALRYE
jgi:putative ABC transport system permease protein